MGGFDEIVDWLVDVLTLVVWADDPIDQMATSLALFAVTVVASSITFGATLVFSFILAVFFLIGLVRFIAETLG